MSKKKYQQQALERPFPFIHSYDYNLSSTSKMQVSISTLLRAVAIAMLLMSGSVTLAAPASDDSFAVEPTPDFP
jgi:hypothetical protein